MGNVRKGQQGGGIESHADALAKGKEKGGQSESLSEEAKLKMDAVVEAEYAEAQEG